MKKQYSPRPRLVGRDSSFVRLIVRGRELLQDREQRARPVLALEADDRRLVVTGRRGDPAAHEHEPGLVLGVVLDLGREHLETRRARARACCRSTAHTGLLRASRPHWAASAVEFVTTSVASGSFAAATSGTARAGWVRDHRGHVAELRTRPARTGCSETGRSTSRWIEQVGVEGERVEGDA